MKRYKQNQHEWILIGEDEECGTLEYCEKCNKYRWDLDTPFELSQDELNAIEESETFFTL